MIGVNGFLLIVFAVIVGNLLYHAKATNVLFSSLANLWRVGVSGLVS